MFQEMLSGDSIMISAKVIACVEEIDCAPVSVFLFKTPNFSVIAFLNKCFPSKNYGNAISLTFCQMKLSTWQK